MLVLYSGGAVYPLSAPPFYKVGIYMKFTKQELEIFKRLMEYELDKVELKYLESNFEDLLEKVTNLTESNES